MKASLTFLLLLIAYPAISQLTGKIINAETGAPIPYVNIWVQDANIGTTTEENGNFSLETTPESLYVVFSAIGFETRTIELKNIKAKIPLIPKTTELQEVVVSSKQAAKELVIGKFKRSKINKFFGCGEKPKIWARYFPYDPIYTDTPFLKKIKVFSISDHKNSTFNLRFYTVGEDGAPGTYLTEKNMIGTAKKGNKFTEIDVSDLNILFPENGFFVAFEWLIIAENKYKDTYKDQGKKVTVTVYNPSLGTVDTATDEKSWLFNEGRWQKAHKNYFDDPSKKAKDLYSQLAIELTLTD